MGKRKDAEATPETPSTSAETPPPAVPAADGTQETQATLDLIQTLKSAPELPKLEVAPSIVPLMPIENPAPLAEEPVEMTAAVEMPKPIELPKPEAIALTTAAATVSDTPHSTTAESPRSSRFALLAASVAIAAALGALTGGLMATAIAWVGSKPESAPAASGAPVAAIDLGSLNDTIGKLRSEVTALRSGVEKGARSAHTEFAKVAERFDRLERANAEHAKLAAASRETTGSIAPPAPPASTSEQAAQKGIVDGWVVRHVSRGVAVIQGRRMGAIEVERGDIVPGLGRIEAIRRQEGRWIVVTAKGVILPAPR